jgi:acyl-CoA synthetase (AMP-forming)/AMP-acid ligase II
MGCKAASPNSFLSPILHRALARPDLSFATFHEGAAWTGVTLGQLLDRALRFAAVLQARRLPPGSTVMLVLRHGPHAPACFIGAMLAGMVPSFLPCPSSKQDHRLYWSQHRALIAFNRPPVVLVEDTLHADMAHAALGPTTAFIQMADIASHPPAAVPDRLPPDAAVGLLQHSSGTTGIKKGVALSYASLSRQLAAYRDALALAPASARIVSWLPLYHDMGLVSSFLLPLWLGVPIVSIDPFDWVARPDVFLQGVERFGATHGWMPNFAFLHLARRAPRDRTWNLSSLQALISCSEPCKPAAFDLFMARFESSGVRPETLQTCYAMAETVFAVSQSAPGHPVRRLEIDPASIQQLGAVRAPPVPGTGTALLSNGRPLNGCEVMILRDGAPLGEMEMGEICLRADYMFSGYRLNPAATAAVIHGGWYHTGDIGFIDRSEVFVVGRMKDVVIVNGKNVFVHDVEAAAAGVAGVRPGRCAAFGRYSDQQGSELLVVVAERDRSQADAHADSLIQRAINRAVVEEVGLPCSDIRIVPPGWLVKTTSGKISRAENGLKYQREFVSSG